MSKAADGPAFLKQRRQNPAFSAAHVCHAGQSALREQGSGCQAPLKGPRSIKGTVSGSALEGGRVDDQTVPQLHSGRQTLATARTAGSENLATAFGGEARAETVATLADQLAGLIGAFHGTYSCFVTGLDGSMRQARQHRWGFDLVFPTKTSLREPELLFPERQDSLVDGGLMTDRGRKVNADARSFR